MPSPFPGMDPYIEMFEWEDFHTRLLPILCDEIVERLPAGYVVRFERRSYVELDVEYDPGGSSPSVKQIVPDLAITRDSTEYELADETATSTLDVDEPQQQRLPEQIERHETYLEIRDLQSRSIITAIELLSPSNKRAGTEGGRLYAEKRRTVLESQSHFVEIDLLRGGQRILLADPGLPAEHDYYVFVSRAEQRPKIDLYSWRLQDRLPGIRIPLKPEHGHVPLNLQRAFQLAYDRARYQTTLDYRRPLVPPIRPQEDAWLQSLLQTVVKSEPDA